MPVKCQTLINIIETYAPKYMAEEWDNVGLQIGDPAREIKKILVTLDVDLAVAREAVDGGYDLIFSHHPLIFKPLKNIRFDLPTGKIISLLMENRVMLYAAHTNLDSAPEGINTVLADKLGLTGQEVLAANAEELTKIAVFVPAEHAESVREAMGKAGAGWIGNYSECSFSVSGTGAFKAMEGADPYIGKVGELAKVPETRLETIVPKNQTGKVLKAMLKAHPYEEVAYDLYPLLNKGRQFGLGKVGYLPEPVTLKELAAKVKSLLNLNNIRLGGSPDKIIKKVALCGGAGASFLHQASFMGADVYLTGDFKYHEAQEALAMGMAFIDAGHHATEKVIVPVMAQYLKEQARAQKLDLTVEVSQINTNPFSEL